MHIASPWQPTNSIGLLKLVLATVKRLQVYRACDGFDDSVASRSVQSTRARGKVVGRQGNANRSGVERSDQFSRLSHDQPAFQDGCERRCFSGVEPACEQAGHVCGVFDGADAGAPFAGSASGGGASSDISKTQGRSTDSAICFLDRFWSCDLPT